MNIELVSVGFRFPFAGRENKSSGPFFAVMSGEQASPRVQNCVVNIELVRAGIDFRSQVARTSPLGLSLQLCQENKSSSSKLCSEHRTKCERSIC